MSSPPILPSTLAAMPEGMLRLIADSVPALIAYYDVHTLLCRFANRRYAEYNGWTAESIVGKTLKEAIGETALAKIDPYVKMAQQGQASKYSRAQTLPNGDIRQIEVNLIPHFDPASPPESASLRGAFVLINDITERWQAEQALRMGEERMRKFAQATGEGILFHKNMVITDLNDAVVRLTGYPRDELLGRITFDFIPQRWHQKIIDHVSSGIEHPYEATLVHKSGHEVHFECTSRSMPFAGESMRLLVLRDITVRRAAQARIEFMALHDTLTQLPNRMYLMERLDSIVALARRHRSQAAVLFVDLDKFKTVNDSLGHHVGDGLLREVASRIAAVVRDSDVVSRLGGDEFIVVLSDVESAHDAALVAGKLIESISAEVSIDGHKLSVSPSIGISLYPQDGDTTGDLVRHADAAMYHAKNNGRGNYQFFKSFMFEPASQAIEKERALKQALQNSEFLLHYQPQRRRADGAIVGLEALVRWQHPELGLVGPDEFIPFAETHGLVVSIDRWVLNEACRQLKAWHLEGALKVPVAINLSAIDFKQRDLVQEVSEVLKTHGLEPKYLEIEITESVLMDSDARVLNQLHQLSAMGVGLTLDDFGTGYSSLAYLRRFPINKLKIDRSFVSDFANDSNEMGGGTAITSAIIQMARSLKLETVAEGVETQMQMDILRDMGCDQFQGFLISHPVNASAVREFLGP